MAIRMSRIDGTRHTLPSSADEVKRALPASIRLLFCGHEGTDPCGREGRHQVGMSEIWRVLARPAGLEPATPGLEEQFWHTRVATLVTEDVRITNKSGPQSAGDVRGASVVTRRRRAAPHP